MLLHGFEEKKKQRSGGLGGAQPPPPFANTMLARLQQDPHTLKYTLHSFKTKKCRGVGGVHVRWVSTRFIWVMCLEACLRGQKTVGGWGGGTAPAPPFANTMLDEARLHSIFNFEACFCTALKRKKTTQRGGWGGRSPPPPFANTRLARRVSTRFICFAARLHG